MTEDNKVTLVLELEGTGEEVTLELTREEYDTIVWTAGRHNMPIREFIQEALRQEIERMSKEENDKEDEENEEN